MDRAPSANAAVEEEGGPDGVGGPRAAPTATVLHSYLSKVLATLGSRLQVLALHCARLERDQSGSGS
ncbi:hypothetical protein NDU88_000063 [Pleurodeles waltl]|uniref:Uncharacterized protein n=1 Tax=Pleurodeles waltl TaxID=8319 RepID=A0AAV7S464_PLEWA|nr:hypothetical protein NDU88_000063 [Pleurodeles waltl]